MSNFGIVEEKRKPKVNLIAGVCEDGVYGINGGLPWDRNLGKSDMLRFKDLTIGKGGNVVIYGSKTMESLGKPLPKRENIVISSKSHHGFHSCSSVKDAVSIAREEFKAREIWICGGRGVWMEALNNDLVDKVEATVFHFEAKPVEGGLYFSELKELERFFPHFYNPISRTIYEAEKPVMTFLTYHRKEKL